MNEYEQEIQRELIAWQKKMHHHPGLLNRFSKKIQDKINSWIPEKIHNGITSAIKQMIKAVIFGAKITSSAPLKQLSLLERELKVQDKIENYRNTAAAEGGITGAGGIFLGLADFPILIGIKIKLLFEIASIYGFDVRDYRERVYLLHIFELAFSSDKHRSEIYQKITDWELKKLALPEDINQFDWRNFQQEYRDYLDLAKMAQLIPIIGAPVGIIVNFRLIKKLGITAMNAYRMRILKA